MRCRWVTSVPRRSPPWPCSPIRTNSSCITTCDAREWGGGDAPSFFLDVTATTEKATGATKRDVLNLCREQGVAFLRLQFTDILGINKNFEVPESQFDKALSGDIRFDGSAIEGFVRIEESDMVLKPDL